MDNNQKEDSILNEVNLTAVGDVIDTLSPADKQAAAEKKIGTVLDSLPKLTADASITNDQGTNDSKTITNAIASAESKPTKTVPVDTTTKPTKKPPGSFTSDTKVGWNAFSQLPNPGDEQAIEELGSKLGLDSLINMYKGVRTPPSVNDNNQDVLAQFLNEAYYGEWYHNTAVMLFTVVFTWLLTRLGGGLMACLVIGAFLATYYQTSIRRLRRNIRDDIQREMSINRLETEVESADWINHFMSRFWLIYEPVLSAQIIGTVDSILVENTPAFLDSIRLTSFTLGTKAPRIESIKTNLKTEPNIVSMDWKFSFTPNDTLDLSERDLQSKVNPKIILTIRVGSGIIGAGMPVLLEDLSFSGHLSLKFRMFNEFPHIKTVEASFLEDPVFDYSLKPVGGETFGFDINNIPGLESFVREQVHATLRPMMYAPNVFTVDVAGIMSGAADLNSANGVLIVKIHSASGLKSSDLLGSLDPYVSLHIGNTKNAELGRTKCIENSNNPKFDETLFVLLNNPNDIFVFEIMDRNTGRSDSSIGSCEYDLRNLADSDNIVGALPLSIKKKGKITGELKFDLHYFPVNAADKSEDGTIIPPVESNSGILRFTVHECKELGGFQKSGGINIPVIGGKSDISPYAVVKVNNQEKLRTQPFKRSINPRWDKQTEIFVTDKTKLKLNVDIFDSSFDEKVLGRWSSMLEDFEDDVFINGQDWWTLKDGSGKIHLSMQWKPITMTGFVEGLSNTYRPPIGVVRVDFKRANNLKNVETIGKSDPYVRIMSGIQNRGQTEHINDNLDPVWNQVLYVPIHSKHENLIFQVMDYNNNSKDKNLGITDFLLMNIMKEVKTEDGQIVYEALKPHIETATLNSHEQKGNRGTIEYTASFIPTLALPKEDEKKKEQHEEEESNNSQVSEEPEIIEKPKELPEKDLHGEVIKYRTVSEDKKQIDLSSYESGVLAVTLHSLSLPEYREVVTELLLDSNDPQFSSTEQKGSLLQINETGTAFVKEMDFSKLVVRVRDARVSEKSEKYIGRTSIEVRKIVERLVKATEDENKTEPVIEELSLLECENGKICLSFSFIPVVQFKLDPAESLENQGNLTVAVVRADELPAADRNNKSDPFIRFYVDDERVFKTDVYKKTVSPEFSKKETFTVPIVNRTVTPMIAKVFDWDQIGKDTLLGTATITFTGEEVETFATVTKTYKLDKGGSITLRLTWRPELVARKRTNTSFISSTTRAFTSAPQNAVGAGVDVGGKMIGAGTKVIGSGVSAIGSGILSMGKFGKKSPTNEQGPGASPEVPSVPSIPTEFASPSQPSNDTNSVLSTSPSNSIKQTSRGISSSDDGNVYQINLIEARGLKAMDRGGTSDPYCRVRVGNKVVFKTRHIKKTLSPDWNESFTTKVKGPLDFKVKDHNTINDVDIGEHLFDVSKIVKPGQPFDGWLPLSPAGTGEIHVKVTAVDSDTVSVTSKAGLFGKK